MVDTIRTAKIESILIFPNPHGAILPLDHCKRRVEGSTSIETYQVVMDGGLAIGDIECAVCLMKLRVGGLEWAAGSLGTSAYAAH